MLFIHQSWLGCDGFCADNCLWLLRNNGPNDVLVSDNLHPYATSIDGDCVNLFSHDDLLEVQRVVDLDGIGDGERVRSAQRWLLLTRLLYMPLRRAR